MQTSLFDAVVQGELGGKSRIHNAIFVIKKEKFRGSFSVYEIPASNESESFIAVSLSKEARVKWGHSLEILSPRSEKALGSGTVLFPSVRKTTIKEAKRKGVLLPQLQKDKATLVAVLAREKGIKGLKENEIVEFAPFTRNTLVPLCQKLEAEGQIRILSFSPLFLLSQTSFEFLCDKIITSIRRYHEIHPDEPGMDKNELRQKFDLPDRIWLLALKHLFREGLIKEVDKRLSLMEFELALTSEEEGLLDRLEDMCLEGNLGSVSMEDLQRHFNLSVRRLQNLLSLLAERRKIVQGEDGFILHSQWLDEIVAKIRKMESKELSVGQFKEMTGLSRKYAIPLLELLDQMGITRRRGPTRIIL